MKEVYGEVKTLRPNDNEEAKLFEELVIFENNTALKTTYYYYYTNCELVEYMFVTFKDDAFQRIEGESYYFETFTVEEEYASRITSSESLEKSNCFEVEKSISEGNQLSGVLPPKLSQRLEFPVELMEVNEAIVQENQCN
ncbi:hypothetical protein [Sediminitomix flava]|uniref:Uncharacterized protein n=1 Tax=Sediminitomix flava TaxID=379075 RepID=A0A315YVC3_SEDFL|nr:hypothetical protein [Sediminitomix flava]PWJ32494.1 hypothetical protein BC781_1222 [Sediminitomix flava]